LIPRPAKVRVSDGTFTLDPTSTLSAQPGLEQVAHWLRGVLGPSTGCWLPEATNSHASLHLSLDPGLHQEGYRLEVRPSGVRLAGGSASGVFYGLQTMRQLLPPAVLRTAGTRTGPWILPALTVEDRPRFAWRGCLLDVARHYLPIADIRRFIDALALHKLNVLHLHLTDDQGWRLEVPKWPRLTEVGSWRWQSMVGARRHARFDGRPHGGYYSGEDIREIVAYAAARYITVVPEIDLPGHAQAALAAYPRLGSTDAQLDVWTAWGISANVLSVSDETLQFCRDVLDEVCDLFPGEFIGVGGDEVPKVQWQASPLARSRMAEHALADTEALQGWFVARLAEHVAIRGRRVYAWDEVLEGGAPRSARIAAWRGRAATAAAARAGHEVVACPSTGFYLDHRQSDDPREPIPVGNLLTLEDVYAFDPVPAELTAEEAARIVGVQANVWTEHMDSARAVDYMVFPRLCAFAEVAWSANQRDFTDFAGRLTVHKGRLAAMGIEFRPDSGPRPWQRRPDARGWPRTAS
jgi:hexosaminidase